MNKYGDYKNNINKLKNSYKSIVATQNTYFTF